MAILFHLFCLCDYDQTTLGKGLMGSTHQYVLPNAKPQMAPPSSVEDKKETSGVAISLDPEELDDLDETALQLKYEEQKEVSVFFFFVFLL